MPEQRVLSLRPAGRAGSAARSSTVTGCSSSGEHGVDERRRAPSSGSRSRCEPRIDGGEVLARVLGLDRPRLQPGPDVVEAGAREPPAVSVGRGEVPRPGPAAQRGVVDGVDRRLHVGDVARAAALGDEPAAGLAALRAGGRRALVVGDPVERRGREDRVDRLVELELEQVATANASTRSPKRALACSTIACVPSTATHARRAARARSSAAVTRPVPQPASSTRSSPSRSSRSSTSRPHAPAGRTCGRRRRRSIRVAAYERTLSHTPAGHQPPLSSGRT